MSTIFLAVPNRGTIWSQAMAGINQASKKHTLIIRDLDGGYAANCFNSLWCEAWSYQVDRFAMHHDDIRCAPGWLDLLEAERERVNADILSVVIPIKDERGLTSTCVLDKDPSVWNARRLTMTEIYDLPETFTLERLAVNTGLWICRFDQPWVDEFPGFRILTRITTTASQKRPGVHGEDWQFSGWAHRHKLRVFATRKVQAFHRGPTEYPNNQPWGTWKTDIEAND